MADKLTVGDLPFNMLDRKELIKKLEGKGINLSNALTAFLDDDADNPNEYAMRYLEKIAKNGFDLTKTKTALIEEASLFISMRLSDIELGQVQPDSEQKVINLVRKFGFDPYDKEKLMEAKSKLVDLAW